MGLRLIVWQMCVCFLQMFPGSEECVLSRLQDDNSLLLCLVNTVPAFRSSLSSDLSSRLTFHSSQLHSQFPASPHCLWRPSAASCSSVFLFHLPLGENWGAWLCSQPCTSRGKWQRGSRFICGVYLLFIYGDTGDVSKAYMYLRVVRMAGMLLEENMSKHYYCWECMHNSRRTSALEKTRQTRIDSEIQSVSSLKSWQFIWHQTG